jgi:hypothetical protein
MEGSGMKIIMLGVTFAIMLVSVPAFAGHDNIQVWDFTTDNCDQVSTGQVCESVTVEVSTSTWCGSSCSGSEKGDTFNKAMDALSAYWLGGLSSQGFRGILLPVCPNHGYFQCQSIYNSGYSNGTISVANLEDGTAGSRNDYTSEIDGHQIIK